MFLSLPLGLAGLKYFILKARGEDVDFVRDFVIMACFFCPLLGLHLILS